MSVVGGEHEKRIASVVGEVGWKACSKIVDQCEIAGAGQVEHLQVRRRRRWSSVSVKLEMNLELS